jgi:DNA (cytosine-5)-methyltransferase 1
MGMPWADWHGCKEAIPPAYSRFIGEQLLEYIREVAA